MQVTGGCMLERAAPDGCQRTPLSFTALSKISQHSSKNKDSVGKLNSFQIVYLSHLSYVFAMQMSTFLFFSYILSHPFLCKLLFHSTSRESANTHTHKLFFTSVWARNNWKLLSRTKKYGGKWSKFSFFFSVCCSVSLTVKFFVFFSKEFNLGNSLFWHSWQLWIILYRIMSEF